MGADATKSCWLSHGPATQPPDQLTGLLFPIIVNECIYILRNKCTYTYAFGPSFRLGGWKLEFTMKKLALVVAAALISAATLSSTGFAATRHQPKTAAEYMYPNMYPEKTPLAANPGVARRKAHYR